MTTKLHQEQPGTSGSRLRPVVVDPDSLESVGFVSKGDKKLTELGAQQEYYKKIVERYLQFCADHTDDLNTAFASLPTSASADATQNPPASAPSVGPRLAKDGQRRVQPPSNELSTLLMSLRKLREAILATSSTTSVSFSQQVHVFSVRLAIRAQHPPSYFPSLRYLIDRLHSPSHPLSDSDLKAVISYLILDYACRQNDMVAAFELRARMHSKYAFKSRTVDDVLASLMHDNWVVFWQVRKGVDAYMRAIMTWAAERVRKHAIKAVGRAYLTADVKWVVESCTGDSLGWTWEQLAETENLQWDKEGEKIVIRRMKPKPDKKLEPIKEIP
ncbi:hypothetical protein ASPZODRAFT_87940 [Penicilliopsis zonata CBS 506.65]|uniref:CSN8/PSMD8/EIF3K domain-containing protein n=1 Tax=Penicilliopsis zonata CBS 506.65 TaxID=1073090 RepID=A0A1L9SWL9_9EURO|nr:hypothetical protein ASPZODRAFT_87940 [Penicilliopsis zonata CBS 506.65]OJJ51507.1 hypothetical protein ASPZODRAFT_87940 [Penicilliopsis zonata CBS 506.65]